MLKKMNLVYRMMLVVVSVFSFSSLQASEKLSSMEFSINGKTTETVVVGTPKNWIKAESVKAPFHYKFTHESGDCEAYLAFSCYNSRPDKDMIFLTVRLMEELYGKNFLKLAQDVFYDRTENSAFFHFAMPKGDKIEHVVLYSYLGDVNLNCVSTFVCVHKDWDPDKGRSYGHSMLESIRFINH
jgi:hypothetical protein